jgi:hypothetical protein
VVSGFEIAVLIQVLAASDEDGLPVWWAARCAAVLGVDGLAVSLAPGVGPAAELLLFSDERAARLENLQFTVGQGPTQEAARLGTACLEPDLLAAQRLWPMFTPAALEARARALFAFPVRLGGIRLGVLTLHRRVNGELGEPAFSDALALADALALFVLTVRLDPDRTAGWGRAGWLDLHRAQVHQAAGMLSVQLGVPVAEALLRLRAHAFAHDLPVLQVARDVLERRLRLAGDPRRP